MEKVVSCELHTFFFYETIVWKTSHFMTFVASLKIPVLRNYKEKEKFETFFQKTFHNLVFCLFIEWR